MLDGLLADLTAAHTFASVLVQTFAQVFYFIGAYLFTFEIRV